MAIDSQLTLQKLEVFRAVVELESVTRAAEVLHVSQPVVSAHLRSLENKVGTGLVYREGRRLRLTAAGAAVYEWARVVLSDTSELSRRLDGISEGSEGTVSVAASMSVGSYLLPPLLSQFRHGRPSVQIALNIFHSDHALKVVDAGECDFGVVLAESHLDSDTIVGRRVGAERLVLVAAPDAEPSDQITIEELARLSFVELPEGFLRRTLNEGYLAGAGLERRLIAIEMGHPEAIKRAVEAGLGVALMFEGSVSRELREGRLREIEVLGFEVRVPICIVQQRRRRFSRAQADVIEWLVESLGDPNRET